MNFNCSIQALCIFMSRIIYKKINANHKLIEVLKRKFKSLKTSVRSLKKNKSMYSTKHSADIQFLNYYYYIY